MSAVFWSALVVAGLIATTGQKASQSSPDTSSPGQRVTSHHHHCHPILLSASKLKAPGRFRVGPRETYRSSPVVRYKIDGSGNVTKVKLLHSSGVRAIDSWCVREVRSRKYEPPSCGAVESQESVTIDFSGEEGR